MSLRQISLRFISYKATMAKERVFTSPHLASPHITSLHLISSHLISPDLTSLHLTSPHLGSRHLTSPHHTTHPGAHNSVLVISYHLISSYLSQRSLYYCFSAKVSCPFLTLFATLGLTPPSQTRVGLYKSSSFSLLENIKG